MMLNSKDTFRYSKGAKHCSELEKRLSNDLHAPYVLATSSCTSALFLAIKSLNIPPGSTILTNAFTFVAVPSAIIQAGCYPLLCEINNDLRLDEHRVKKSLEENSIAAILVSNIRGHISNMDFLLTQAKTYGIPVIEDAAHCYGASWDGSPIGTLGDVGCFSFQSYKMVRCGEGGALVTNRPEVAARATLMSGAYEENWRSHLAPCGLCAELQGTLPSFNCRLSELCAAHALSEIGIAPSRISRFRDVYTIFSNAFGDTDNLRLPVPNKKEFRAPDSIQFLMPGKSIGDILGFTDTLGKKGIPIEPFGANPKNARCFWNWKFLDEQPHLPATRKYLCELVEIRFEDKITNDDIMRYIDELKFISA